MLLDIPHVRPKAGAASGRPLGAIVRQPDFLVALGCATSAYAMMSFVMTAAPLAMVMHHHHQHAAVLGIQWHVLAMYLPSFVTGSLIARFGAAQSRRLRDCSCFSAARSSRSLEAAVAHFWLALVLLGSAGTLPSSPARPW